MSNNNEKYVAEYFKKTRKIVDQQKQDSIITLQFFQWKNNMVLCGINEALKFLEENSNIEKYKVRFLEEGTIVNSKDVILELEGPYKEFGIWEGVIDGIIARASSIATNARNVIIAAKQKEVIFMGDRADHYINQERDGYAAFVGGIKTQVTQAQISQIDGKAIGTVPHVLIQMHEGDIVKALENYEKVLPEETRLVALVDFNNDVINDSLRCLKRFDKKLSAVRVDTSSNISDKFFTKQEEKGVTPNLIKGLRKSLNENNGQHVKIIVSSGFCEEKIKDFENENTPVDYYGVGASLLKINHLISADAVMVNGEKLAKFGRGYQENKNLKEY